MAYNLLSEPIRKYIRDKRWESLRSIQAAAIPRIINTDDNYILASRTASGKTEAAFLPILSKVDFNKSGVQVLYISPLIALINDQFYRIEELCRNLEISVTKWHGEANRTLKTNLIKSPNGIVLITPESLEAMFVNAPYNIKVLFGNLNYIVIDEIHSFLGVDRGLQLMSILSRIQQVNSSRIKIIGLSATIGDENFIEAKRLTGNIDQTKILVDRTKKETEAKFKYFKGETTALPLELLKDLYKETYSNKVLIFPNSRGRAEEVAVKLRRISDRVNGHTYYYSHHSSVDKEIRENIEHFAKNNERFNFCIACTSTLELGIDIGTIDKIVQIDSTHSVSSLVQRIGRSGRREGDKSIVNIYATHKWSLLQSLACWNLYNSDFIEPIHIAKKPYDILFHQLLSIVKQLSGCTREELLRRIAVNPTFSFIEEQDVKNIIEDCISKDYIEALGKELIIGIEGEKIVNSREFYSVFKTEVNFKVIHAGRSIGDMPLSTQVQIDENIFLAARIWKIIDIDFKGLKIIVQPAKDGKNPRFGGDGGNIHKEIREEMLHILKSTKDYEELEDSSTQNLEEMRYDFKDFKINNFEKDRPVIKKEEKIYIYTFTGSKINRSLSFLLSMTNTNAFLIDSTSTIELESSIEGFENIVKEVNELYKNIDKHLLSHLEVNERLIEFCKWGEYLPKEYQAEILKERLFDFENAVAFINNINLVESD